MASPLLSQAITVVQQAIQHDSAGNVAQAVVYYQQALELFRQAHSVERDPNLAATILAKYQEYSARAELLRSSMQATPPAVAQPNIAPLIQQPVPPTSAYRTASHQSPLQRALELAQHADREYKHNNFVVALELYKECADIYLELLKKESNPSLKASYLESVQSYVNRAEKLQEYVEKTQPHLLEAMRAAKVEEERRRREAEVASIPPPSMVPRNLLAPSFSSFVSFPPPAISPPVSNTSPYMASTAQSMPPASTRGGLPNAAPQPVAAIPQPPATGNFPGMFSAGSSMPYLAVPDGTMLTSSTGALPPIAPPRPLSAELAMLPKSPSSPSVSELAVTAAAETGPGGNASPPTQPLEREGSFGGKFRDFTIGKEIVAKFYNNKQPMTMRAGLTKSRFKSGEKVMIRIELDNPTSVTVKSLFVSLKVKDKGSKQKKKRSTYTQDGRFPIKEDIYKGVVSFTLPPDLEPTEPHRSYELNVKAKVSGHRDAVIVFPIAIE